MVTKTVDQVLDQTGCRRWIDYSVDRIHELTWRHETHKCGGAPIKRCVGSRWRFELAWKFNQENIRKDSRCDGISPLVTNRQDLSALQIYSACHRNHSFLELRHDLLKNTLQVIPAYIHNVTRLEAFLFLEYVAITIHALVERALRQGMRSRHLEDVPLYPEERDCRAPTAVRLFDVFEHLAVHDLISEDRTIQRFQPKLNQLQLDMLDLLGLSADIYSAP